MRTTTRKGQFANLAPIMLILIIAAFVLVLGLQLLQGFQNSTDNYVGTVTNEEGSINSTGYTLLKSTTAGYNSQAIVTVKNGTSGAVIAAGNYTLSGSTFTNKTAAVWPVVNFSYSYKYGQESYTTSNQTIYDVGGFAEYWELIVLAVVIGLIVTLLLVAFGSRKVK